MAFSFMQTISFIYLLIIRICIASLLRHEHECLALLEFKQSILDQSHASFNVGGFQKHDSWRKIISNASDHDSDCCLWDGVVCSKKGHVIGLDLSQSSLRGPLKSNSSLFNLVHLQMLNLSMNDFVGSQIPSQIAHLKQLRSLDLSHSSFSGQIPIEISHLPHLNLLDLSWNSLKIRNHSFKCLLQNLTGLEQLHLSGIDISSIIPPFLANFSSLKSIELENCSLRGEFPSQIFYLPKLKFLSVAANHILTGFIPEFLNTSLLEQVFLAATSFTGSIPQSIIKLNYLKFLGLHECYFSGCIPCSLANMTELTFLGLGQDELMGLNPLFPKGLSYPVGLEVCEKRRMHDWIIKLTKLEILILININIYDEILPALANLTKLSTVIMRNNLISGRIPSSFMNLTQLKTIDIRGNQLQGQISSSFSNFKSLECLILENNNFNGVVDVDTFLGLPKLDALGLGANKILVFDSTSYSNVTLLPEIELIGLSSCNLIEFPSFLRFQKKIKFLSLQNNKIKGLVPEWFLNNTQETLQYLDLSHNSITGFHGHSYFLPWVRLDVFNIKYNQLQGQVPIPPLTTVVYVVSNNNLTKEIPSLICELKHLRVLDLSFNNMTGTLPPCFGNLSNLLFVLDLKGNNFHGPMMNAFTHGSLMKRIDLTENQFTGQLSKSLANCTNLEFLALGGNSFEDVFPIWLGNLVKLQVLILRSNNFFGAIHGYPITGLSFLKLRIIDLSYNGFSGQLPDMFFRTWNAMKPFDVGKSSFMDVELYINPRIFFKFPYSMALTNKGFHREFPHIFKFFSFIDLSCNNFEGHIPESLSDLHGLQSINLSNNHLTGRIMPLLGNLKNLESLDLSCNELSGGIPHEFLQLGFLEFFNASFNHLNGVIPLGNQFNTFDKNSYMGNHGLCGKPLSKECKIPMISTLSSTNKEYNSFLPGDKIDWIIIFLGFGGGLVIGIFLGNLLYARYGDCLLNNFK